MNVAVRVPRIAAPGVCMLADSLAVEAGAMVVAGARLLDVRIGLLTASVHSDVSGTVHDVRVAAGDVLSSGRVMLWIESQTLPPLAAEPAREAAPDHKALPNHLHFHLPPDLLPSHTVVVEDVRIEGQALALAVSLGLLRFAWRAAADRPIAEVLVKPGGKLQDGIVIARLEGGAAAESETPFAPPCLQIPEMTLAEFRATAGRLHGPVAELARLAAIAGSAQGAELLRAEMARLASSRFTIAVAGEFKRGKSTFLNALAGGEFLPNDVVPCTAFACRFQFGDVPQLVLVDTEGVETIQPFTALAEIAAELDRLTRDPATSIGEAILRLPLEICRDGVDLMDTPGLNDSEAMNRVTLSVLPNVDAAVLLLIPESPLSGTERSFLTDHLLNKDIGRILFVLAAKDRVPAGQLDRLTGYLERQLAEILAARGKSLGRTPTGTEFAAVKLLPISSRQELDHPGSPSSGFVELRRHLDHLIFRERGRLLLAQMRQRIHRAAGEAKNSAQLRVTQSAVSREAFQASLQDSAERIALTRLHANDLRSRLAEAREKAEAAADSHARQLSTALEGMRDALPEQIPAALLQRPPDEIKTELAALLQQNAGRMYQEALTLLLLAVEGTYDPVARAVRRFFDQTARLAAELDAPPETLEFGGGFPFRIDLSLGALSWLRLADAAKSVLAGRDLASSIETRALANLRESFAREIEEQVRRTSGESILRSKLVEFVRQPFHHLLRRFDQEVKALLEDAEATLARLNQPAGESGEEGRAWQEIYRQIQRAAEECDAMILGRSTAAISHDPAEPLSAGGEPA